MRSDFKDYIRRCHLCQINKQPATLPDRIVTPLPVPRKPFSSITIDFAGRFTSSNKKEPILVLLHRFTGFTYVIPVSQNITAVQTAIILMEGIFSLHGFPTSLVSDRDPRFTSCSWQQFMAQIRIGLNMATAYHNRPMAKLNAESEHYTKASSTMLAPKEPNGLATFPMFKQLTMPDCYTHVNNSLLLVRGGVNNRKNVCPNSNVHEEYVCSEASVAATQDTRTVHVQWS